MPFHRGVDPAHNLTVENSGEGDPVVGARQLLDALAKIASRAGIAELAAQCSGRFCIVCREPANRNSRDISFNEVPHVVLLRVRVCGLAEVRKVRNEKHSRRYLSVFALESLCHCCGRKPDSETSRPRLLQTRADRLQTKRSL